MSGSALDGTHGALPVPCVLGLDVALHHTSSGEADECRAHGQQHLGQVAAASVGPVLESGREEAHHIEHHRAGLLGREHELGLRVAALCGDDGFQVTPLALHPALHLAAAQQGAVLAAQTGCELARLACLGAYPQREAVLSAFLHADAPEPGIAHTASGSLDAYPECLLLHIVEHAFAAEFQLALQWLPAVRLPVRKLQRAVAYQFGIESAIGCMIDVFEEDAVERGAHLCALVGQVNLHIHLRRRCQSHAEQSHKGCCETMIHVCSCLAVSAPVLAQLSRTPGTLHAKLTNLAGTSKHQGVGFRREKRP